MSKALFLIVQIAFGSYIGFQLAKFSWLIIWHFDGFRPHLFFFDFLYSFVHGSVVLASYLISFIICAGTSFLTTIFVPWIGRAMAVVSGLGLLLRLLFTLGILPSHL